MATGESKGSKRLEKLEPSTEVDSSAPLVPDPLTDDRGLDELAVAFRDGDRKAGDIFFRRLWKLAYSVATNRYGLLREDAEDIAQKVCLIVVSKADYRFHFSTWTFATASYCCKNLVRKRDRSDRELPHDSASGEAVLSGSIEPGCDEKIIDLRREITKLPTMERTVLRMRFALGMSWEEIDAELFEGEECSRYRASVAVARLSRRLRPRGSRSSIRTNAC